MSPNPSGSNQFQREPAYGAVKKLADNARQAPMSGATVAAEATNAPRRAGNAAKRGETVIKATPDAAATGPFPERPSEGPSYEEQVAAAWADLAKDPKSSPLVREYAKEAARLAGLED